jgi:GT2 family glycosyltransferase
MPVRNGAATIASAVRSTLRAMPRDSELVVWDDASTDRTLELLESIRDPRIRVIESASHVGPGAAVASLMSATDSGFVARMDADDVCLPWRFAYQLAHLEGTRTDILFSATVRFRTRPLRVAPSAPATITPDAMPLHLAVMCMVTCPTMTASRAAIDAAGGFREMVAEDYDLWLRACVAGLRLTRSGVPAIAYRRHAAQLSSSDGFRRRAQSDELFIETYRAFTRSTLGVECEWVPGAPAVSESDRSAVDALRRSLRARSAALPAHQRRLLERTLRVLPAS